MPATVCTKDFNVSEDDFRYSDGSRPTLRDMVLKATNDGDFQSADVSFGWLTVEAIVRRKDGQGQVSRKRHFDLRSPLFASIADCLVEEDEIKYPDCEE
jgi:hypothetical protein